MTAPSLSLPAISLGAARRQLQTSPGLLRAVVALAPVLAAVALDQMLDGGTRIALDPALPLLFAVVVAATVGGMRVGLVAAAVAVGYGLLVYARPPLVGVDGNGLRVLVFAFSVPAAAVLIGSLRDRLDGFTSGSGSVRAMSDRVRDFSEALAHSRPEVLPALVVNQAAMMAAADMAVLTIVDRRTDRQLVRAVHGTSRAVVGVEVLPGVGLAGQALRDQQTVVVGRPSEPSRGLRGTLATRLLSLLDGVPLPSRPAARLVPPAIAVPLRHAGAIVATLTLGRADPRRPFTDDEQRLIELVAPQVGLAVANGLLRGQLREASLRDPLTGLYNRSYLDAALDQLLALRRRTPADQRRSLSLIQFGVDGLRELGEAHGPQVADQVVRAMSALLRQRFRQSDTIARVDADAFVVVMDGAALESAAEAAGHIRSKMREMSLVDERGAPLTVSVSAGCAAFSDDMGQSEDLIRTVRAALDTARWSGQGAVVAI